MSGPGRPVPASMVRQPRYSISAAEEMVAMRSTWAAAARKLANPRDIPSIAVSAAITGTQSKPINPVVDPENRAKA